MGGGRSVPHDPYYINGKVLYGRWRVFVTRARRRSGREILSVPDRIYRDVRVQYHPHETCRSRVAVFTRSHARNTHARGITDGRRWVYLEFRGSRYEYIIVWWGRSRGDDHQMGSCVEEG